MSLVRLVGLTLAGHRRRLLALLAFAALFLAASATAAVLGRDPAGHVEIGTLFQVGGYPLVSAILLLGWLLGRFPLAATLVLTAGLFSGERERGLARLLAVRPQPPAAVYGARLFALMLVAFALSALLLPVFDLIMLGAWAGPATLVLIAAYVLVYAGLTALLSAFTRYDAWIALLLALAAMVWAAAGQAGALPVPDPVADIVGFLLPPQSRLFRLEGAFAGVEPIPWGAFAFCAGYGFAALALAALAVRRREI